MDVHVISRYIDQALRRAHYERVDDLCCATVPGLRGAIATGDTLEAYRDQLAEVVEEWILACACEITVEGANRTDQPAQRQARPKGRPQVFATLRN